MDRRGGRLKRRLIEAFCFVLLDDLSPMLPPASEAQPRPPWSGQDLEGHRATARPEGIHRLERTMHFEQ